MKKRNISLILFFMINISVGLYSCSSYKEETPEPTPNPIPAEPSGEYSSEMPNTLNVVYFVPNDMQGSKTYHKRLSGVMLWMQEWYKQQMIRYGYGTKTFGLLKDTNLPDVYVKITKITAKQGKDYYPYSGGGQKAIPEIKEYFAAHPEEENSDHTIIFMPSTKGQHGSDAGGQPFYGLGRWCFALDYEFFDMKYWNTDPQEVRWIGGTIHELGHCLNLPHNKQLATEDWISMMADGNHYLYQTPDKINFTAADAAILNNNEVFNTGEIDYYEKEADFELKKMRIYADNDNLYLNAKFTTDIPVNAIIAYNDPHVKDGDADYNAVTWTTTEINDGTATLTMPLNGIHSEFNVFPFEMRVKFCHENGRNTSFVYNYQFVDGKPDIDINVEEIAEIDKTMWKVLSINSEDTGNPNPPAGHKEALIDGDINVIWHSQWREDPTSYPYEFVIDLSKEETLNGMFFYQRQNNTNGSVKDIEILTSTDNTTFTSAGEFSLGMATSRQDVKFSTPASSRFIKVILKNSNVEGNISVCSLGEVGAF
ncbi:discoidin domain-containing protein [Saccharicrinis sp. GN24d3]|uniref:discoidin domain-containing protein n=1 Tax=Saccharicrinis sp. GN24d3 TaxID=3458416 RepID=UPI00403652F1